MDDCLSPHAQGIALATAHCKACRERNSSASIATSAELTTTSFNSPHGVLPRYIKWPDPGEAEVVEMSHSSGYESPETYNERQSASAISPDPEDFELTLETEHVPSTLLHPSPPEEPNSLHPYPPLKSVTEMSYRPEDEISVTYDRKGIKSALESVFNDGDVPTIKSDHKPTEFPPAN